MSTTRLIRNKHLEEFFIVQYLGNYYQIRFDSDLELFIKYKTTGSVSKSSIKIGIPPEIRIKLVDDRSCSITHTSNFKFSFHVYPLGNADELKSKTFIEIKKFSNFLINILEGYISLGLSSIASLGFGGLCACGGALGKAAVEQSKNLYITSFDKMLEEISNFLGVHFQDTIRDVYNGVTQIIPISLDFKKIKDKHSFIHKICFDQIGRNCTSTEMNELLELNSIKLINSRIIDYAIYDLLKYFPKQKINEVFNELQKIVNRLPEIHSHVKESLENNDYRKLQTVKGHKERFLPILNIQSPVIEDTSSIIHLIGNSCLLTPGNKGIMNPNYFKDDPIASKKISFLYSSFMHKSELILKVLKEIDQLKTTLNALDEYSLELNNFETFVREEYSSLKQPFIGYETFWLGYLKCTNSVGEHPMMSEYNSFLYEIENPQFWWSDPPKPDFELKNQIEHSNILLNHSSSIDDFGELKWESILEFLPNKVKSKNDSNLIINFLKTVIKRENLNSNTLAKFNNLLFNYNNLESDVFSPEIERELNQIKNDLNTKFSSENKG